MTEVVVPRLADDVAILPVVRVAADQPVLVLQLAVLSVHPAGAGVQALGLGDPVEEGLVGSGYNLSVLVFVISLDDQTECSRPLKVDIESDRRSRDLQIVGAQDGCDLLSEGAALLEVDLVLEMFEANSELGVALSPAVPTAPQVLTTRSVNIFSSGVVKFL